MLAGEGGAELVSAVAWRVAAGVGIAPRRATVVVGGLRRGEGYQGSESKLQEERGGLSEIQSSPGGPNIVHVKSHGYYCLRPLARHSLTRWILETARISDMLFAKHRTYQ